MSNAYGQFKRRPDSTSTAHAALASLEVLMDMFLLVAYEGLGDSGDTEGIEGVAVIPQKGMQSEGVMVRCEAAHAALDELRREVMQLSDGFARRANRLSKRYLWKLGRLGDDT